MQARKRIQPLQNLSGNQPPMNTIRLINLDTSLSQFKYHFYLRKVYMPAFQFPQFSQNAYRGFNLKLHPNCIYIIQLQDIKEQYYDFAIGFRRDDQAMFVWENTRKFWFNGRESQVQLAGAFALYVDKMQKNKGQKEGKRSRSSSQESRERSRNQRDNIRDINRVRSDQRIDKQYQYQRRRPQPFLARHCLSMIPIQYNRQTIQKKLCQTLKIQLRDFYLQRAQDSTMTLWVKSQSLHSYLTSLPGIQLSQTYLLLFKQSDIGWQTAKQQLQKHQLRAFHLDRMNQSCFQQLFIYFINFKQFANRVIHMCYQHGGIIVTFQSFISNVIKFIKLPGWKFQMVQANNRVVVSLGDRWFRAKHCK